HPGRDAVPRDAVEAVAACDDVALDRHACAIEEEGDRRPFGLEIVHSDIARLEEDRVTCRQPDRDQVFDDLLLPVHGDATTAGERAEVDAVVASAEPQLDAVVHEALTAHPRSDSGRVEKVRAGLLEHAGTNTVLDVPPCARLDDHRLDALEAQQMSEQ